MDSTKNTMGLPAQEKRTKCFKSPEEIDESNKRLFKTKANRAIHLALNLANIPLRYSGIELYEITASGDEQAAIIARCKKFVDKFAELKLLGSSLIFTGKPGTGKTMIALASIREIIKNNFRESYDPDEDYMFPSGIDKVSSPVALYVNTYNLFAEIKATYNKSSQETERDVIAKYSDVDLLVIDEVGAQVGTDFEAMLMFRIINARYENMRPTFIISNLTEADLSTYIGERVVDRFHENHGAVFVFNWDSYRRK